MKYTYRDECIIRDKGDIGSFVLLAIWICATLAIFLIDGYLIVYKDSSIGSPVIGGMFAIVVVAIAVCIYRSISKRRRRALLTRRKAMEQGTRYDGRIVDAGMEKEYEKYETTDEDNHRETHHRMVPNYWINVEYFEPQAGELKRFRAVHMVRGMKRFIGSRVDVYVWHEWSEFISSDLTLTYIDTSALG